MSVTIARQVIGRVNNRESLYCGSALSSLAQDLQELASADHELEKAASERRMNEVLSAYGYGRMEPAASKPFLYADGVAIIPCHGTLINRFSYSWGFVTGYNFLRAQLNAALEDEDVKLIVFDINSNGGEASGCFEISDDIFKSRDKKPTLAVVDANGNSAAYAIGCACSKMVCTPSGWVGSIGVISQHVDISENLKMNGIKVTVIAEDAHKADGNPFEPLPPDVLADIRASVAKRYGEFVELVARNRGLDSQAIRDTQSRAYRADDALALELIDTVQSPSVAVSEYLGELGSDEPAEEEDDQDMADQAKDPKLEISVDTDKLAADARTAERQRIAGIQSCDEAKGKPKLAAHLALNTSMSIDEAKAILGAAAVETAEAPKVEQRQGDDDKDQRTERNAFKDAMNKDKHPNPGADDGKDGNGEGGEQRQSRAARAADMAFGPRKEDQQRRLTH